MGNDDYRKQVVPKDEYMMTVVHAEFNGPFYLWWVIDTGKHIGHKISQEFPCSEFGDRMIQRMCNRLRTTYYPTITDPTPIFPMQFLGTRGKVSVDIKHDNGFTRNIITHHQPALAPPEQNVIKSRSVDHFYQEQTGRRLPL